MAREKQDFRDNLEFINERFEGKQLITLKESSEYTGCTVKQLRLDKSFPIKRVGGRDYVPVVALARWLS